MIKYHNIKDYIDTIKEYQCSIVEKNGELVYLDKYGNQHIFLLLPYPTPINEEQKIKLAKILKIPNQPGTKRAASMEEFNSLLRNEG